MAHLFDSLKARQRIGHYGRLVFAMVARSASRQNRSA